MAKPRSTLLVVIGAAVFVLGAGLAFLALNSGDDGKSAEIEAAAATSGAPAAPAPGQVVPAGGTVPAFEIPGGKQAVAVQIPHVQGVAGFVKAKDKINVYGNIKPNNPAPRNAPTPLTKLVLDNVEVLAVSAGPTGAAATGGPTQAPITFVLALSPADAEQLIYFQTFESVYFTLSRADQPAIDTPGTGRSGANAF